MANISSLSDIEKLVSSCKRCDLCEVRTNTVPGTGNPQARIMIVGEGPGEAEDLQGKPFVGRSGDLLDLAFSKAGLSREQVFITNIVKCRPPSNRNPRSWEMSECYIYLAHQIEIIKPLLIVTLGKVAAERILQRPVKITKENGCATYAAEETGLGDQLFLTVLHPAYVLRNRTPAVESAFFQAIQTAKDVAYGRANAEIPKRRY